MASAEFGTLVPEYAGCITMVESRIRNLALRCIELQCVSDQMVGKISRALEEGGFISRAEATDLMRIERDVAQVAEAWGDLFVAAITAHLVWEERPVGRLAAQDLRWLAGEIGQPRPGAAAAIGRLLLQIVRESEVSEPALVRMALRENSGESLDSGGFGPAGRAA